jgi:hypothetical protein
VHCRFLCRPDSQLLQPIISVSQLISWIRYPVARWLRSAAFSMTSHGDRHNAAERMIRPIALGREDLAVAGSGKALLVLVRVFWLWGRRVGCASRINQRDRHLIADCAMRPFFVVDPMQARRGA